MAKGVVKIKVVGDASGFDKAMSSVSGSLGKLGGIAKTGGLVLGAALGAAGVGMLSLVDDAAKLQQNIEKANTVFGSSKGVVDDWAKTNANAMGLTKNEATGLAASFGDLLVPMGFTREQAAAMSTDVVGLSGALSAWTGGTTSAAEVSDVLAKAMLGERDGLKALGISVSDADVKQRLATMGMEDAEGAALAQATAIATQQLIMEKSTDAQAAFADGTKTIGERLLEAKAGVGEMKDGLVKALLPAFEGLLSWVNSNMPTIQAVISTVFDAISKVVSWVGENVVPALKEAFGIFKGWLDSNMPTIRAIFETVFDAIGVAINFITDTVVPAIKDGIAKFRDWFSGAEGGSKISEVFDTIKGVADIMRALIVDVVWPKVQEAIQTFQTWFDEHGDSIKTIFNAIKDAAKAIVDFVQNNWGTISSVLKTVWDIAKVPLDLMLTIFGGILDAIAFVITKVRDNWPEIKASLQTVWDVIKVPLQAMKDMFIAIRDAVQWVIDKINLLNSTHVQKKQVDAGLSMAYGGGQYKPSTSRAGSGVRQYADGGIVSGLGAVPILAHGGERVLTNQQTALFERMVAALEGGARSAGRGDTTIHVSGNDGLDIAHQIAGALATI